MCTSYPELCCSAACGPAGNNPLTPVPDANGRNVSLDAIQAVLGEMASISPSEFFHLGGDEVRCVSKSPPYSVKRKATHLKNNAMDVKDKAMDFSFARASP